MRCKRTLTVSYRGPVYPCTVTEEHDGTRTRPHKCDSEGVGFAVWFVEDGQLIVDRIVDLRPTE